ncbi:MAG: uracil-DNA glycosylase family protein [Bacteroidota bacterium]
MENLLREISACQICKDSLELGPRPVLSAAENSKIIIIGQAPGLAVHQSGVPWDDKSGDNLRMWMGVSKEEFYNPENIAILPMGFCYPGKGKSGDLPPRKECAPQWHHLILSKMNQADLVLLIGNYAQKYYLKEQLNSNLTDTVRDFRAYLPNYFVLPHPSPRNNIWQAKNPWFKAEVLPELQFQIGIILRGTNKGD